MQPVRVGVVGMGIGRANGKALARNPRGRVVALCDLLEARMRDMDDGSRARQRRDGARSSALTIGGTT